MVSFLHVSLNFFVCFCFIAGQCEINRSKKGGRCSVNKAGSTSYQIHILSFLQFARNSLAANLLQRCRVISLGHFNFGNALESNKFTLISSESI